MEKYGLSPKSLIEVKGLAGDSSDNIPGIPGVGEKTAINLIKEYKNIEGIYKNIDKQKGKLKERLEENKELAFLSRTLGTIDVHTPIDKDLNEMKVGEWDKAKVAELFAKLKFNRFIERFELEKEQTSKTTEEFDLRCEELLESNLNKLKEEIKQSKKMFYYIIKKEKLNSGILNKTIAGITKKH